MISSKLREYSYTKVCEVMMKEYPVIDKDQSILQAIREMDKYGIDRIVVVENGEPIGIMTKKDVVNKLLVERTRRSSAARMHVSSFMSSPIIKINEGENIVEAARKMVEKDISSLLVVDSEGNPKGLVTKWGLVSIYRFVDDMHVRDALEPVIYTPRFGDRVIHLRALMLEKKFFFAPVVDLNGRVAGVVSIDEIADAIITFYEFVPEKFRRRKRRELYVEEIMRRPPLTVKLDDTLSQVSHELLRSRSRGAVVVDEEEKILGVVTIDGLTKTLSIVE